MTTRRAGRRSPNVGSLPPSCGGAWKTGSAWGGIAGSWSGHWPGWPAAGGWRSATSATRPSTRRSSTSPAPSSASTLFRDYETACKELDYTPSRIPDFKSKEEEAAWWDTHDLGDSLDEFREVKVVTGKNLSATLHIRPDAETLAASRREAEATGIGTTTTVRMWVKERLRREAEAAANQSGRSSSACCAPSQLAGVDKNPAGCCDIAHCIRRVWPLQRSSSASATMMPAGPRR